MIIKQFSRKPLILQPTRFQRFTVRYPSIIMIYFYEKSKIVLHWKFSKKFFKEREKKASWEKAPKSQKMDSQFVWKKIEG